MTAPTAELTLAQRERLKMLKWEKSGAVPPGRVMLCKGRKVNGYCNVSDLAHTKTIEAKATTVCLSNDDFDDVKRWLA